MTSRQKKIFSVIPNCETFADVGCDHGYLTKAVLDSGKCKYAVVSDISEKCLEKAKALLYKQIQEGRVKAVVCNGFDKVGKVDLALIAGMGGMEIISILKKAQYLPEGLVLQPMKNTPELRKVLLELGYAFTLDSVFYAEDKYYNLIVVKKGEDFLTEQEILFGRTNLVELGEDFKRMLKVQIAEYEKILKGNLSASAREQLEKKITELKKYV